MVFKEPPAALLNQSCTSKFDVFILIGLGMIFINTNFSRFIA